MLILMRILYSEIKELLPALSPPGFSSARCFITQRREKCFSFSVGGNSGTQDRV